MTETLTADWSWAEKAICDPEILWEHGKRAYQITHSGVRLYVVTNGRVLLAVPGEHGGAEPDEKTARSFAQVLTYRPDTPAVEFDWSELQRFLNVRTDYPETCWACDGVGHEGECKTCGGVGFASCTCISCDNEHETDCEDCDGIGVLTCDTCKIVMYPSEHVRLHGMVFNAKVLRPLAWRLRGERVLWRESRPITSDSLPAAIIIGDPWTLLVMPMRDTDGTAKDAKVFHPLSVREERDNG